jgi:hypothetical protein
VRLVCILISLSVFVESCQSFSFSKKNTEGAKRNAAIITTTAIRSDSLPYLEMKNEIAVEKQLLRQSLTTLQGPERTRLLKEAFVTMLADSIIPYWYGTPWDFNGITETPGEGKIACGYFITTTLRDMGYKINRYKVAQMASMNIISALVQKKYTATYYGASFDQFIAKLKLAGRSFYVVGLDNHVGYLYHDGTELYFIHSTFVGKSCVMKELAAESSVLAASNYRITGNISADEAFLEKWITGD